MTHFVYHEGNSVWKIGTNTNWKSLIGFTVFDLKKIKLLKLKETKVEWLFKIIVRLEKLFYRFMVINQPKFKHIDRKSTSRYTSMLLKFFNDN